MHFLDGYCNELAEALRAVDRGAFDGVVAALVTAQAEDRFVYVCGNGGSAATASHMINDIVKAPAIATGCRPIRAIGLTDCVPLMTALANDIDYAEAFAWELAAYGRAGDVLVAISGSGNSPNILEAAKTAKARGMLVIGMTGYDGGKLKNLADIDLHVPCHCMAQVEDAHLVLEHAIVETLKERLKDAPRP
ncbi:MAG TPA: SIS domain-containing protein [Candidatus Hydrogenedentes bacterium]|nr:SIS domain-containing protein [Candidatus Hydrogenedentota bacterium]HPG68358.1 SIS domain-containing protein [Candidatus Hydrogenedentota bacterium]